MQENVLWYRAAAGIWEEAMPVGNGRLGAMVFGRTDRELFQLNEDTLWSGFPRDAQNPTAASHLPQARRLILEGRFLEAQDLIEGEMLGPWNESYQPLGDLSLQWKRPALITDYRRELNLQTGVAAARYKRDGYRVVVETFVSNPDQIMVVTLETEEPSGLDVTVRLSSQLPGEVRSLTSGRLQLAGRSPSHVEPSYLMVSDAVQYDPAEPGMSFAIQAEVSKTGGVLHIAADELRVTGARRMALRLAAATSFAGFDRNPATEGKDPQAACEAFLYAAAGRTEEQLKRRHIDDHRALFERVELDLCGADFSHLPTDERLMRFEREGEDLGLAALLFQYGRYLLIGSSRPGCQPANLQGIWNRDVRPPWSSNWTTNINTQMNYWPAEPCNLSELSQPLLRMIEEIALTGAETARRQFDCGGWAACHNVDLWRATVPVGGAARWAYWPMGGAWLCRHLWEHFLFTGDTAWLKESAYPLMRGAAQFLLDWLVEGPQGQLVTCPSTSPENGFLTQEGPPCCVSMASTMDTAITRDLFAACMEAAGILEQEDSFLESIRQALPRLAPYRVGAQGQLQEWYWDFPEEEPNHRHVSHLYGLYPAGQIDPRRTPELAEACKQTLDRRGDDGTGWSLAWKINLWARLWDGNRCWKLIRRQLRPVVPAEVDYVGGGGTYMNLLDAHPPFQIDGNFGTTAGIAEMLLQSQNGCLRLLAALPDAWPEGSVKGLRARGNLTVDIAWQSGRLQHAVIHAAAPGRITLAYGQRIWDMVLTEGANSIDTATR